jgi:hypothetical protein
MVPGDHDARQAGSGQGGAREPLHGQEAPLVRKQGLVVPPVAVGVVHTGMGT